MSKIWFSKTTIFDKITAAFSIGGGHSKPRRAGHKLTKRAKITLTLCTLALITTATIMIVKSPTTDSIQQLYIGADQVKDIYIGNTPVNKVYLGDQLIWERESLPTDIQTISAANCPDTRTKVRDARDGATYWVRKIPNTKTLGGSGDLCWMETNLAYAGDGDNTYGDATANIPLGTTSSGASYERPYYYNPPGSNRTIGTTDPSTSTDGTGQYGYLYNWCAAMNRQPAACIRNDGTVSSQPNQSANGGTSETLYNICPLGWRLPTGGASGGEFNSLNATINRGETGNIDSLRTDGLYMFSGYRDTFDPLFHAQGVSGRYWSSTTIDGKYENRAYSFDFSSSGPNPNQLYWGKWGGLAVRCVAG